MKRIRFILRILFLMLAGTALTIGAGIYWIVTPDFLENRILGPLRKTTGISVTVQDFNLGWQGIDLQGVVLYDPSKSPPGTANPNKESEPLNGKALVRIQEITLRPSLVDLLRGHIRIPVIFLEGLELTIRRDGSGRSNLERLLDALPKNESEDTATNIPFELDLHAVHLQDARLSYFDSFERARRPLKVNLGIEDLSLSGLDTNGPWSFVLSSQVEIGDDTRSTIEATGSIHPSPLFIETDLALSEIDVDTLVDNLATGDDAEVAAIDTGATIIRAELAVDRVRYEGVAFTGAKGTLSLEESTISFPKVTAAVAAGRARVSAKVRLGVTDLAYSGSLSLTEIKLARVGGLLSGIPWGSVEPTASIEGKLSMAGTTGQRLLDTLSLDLEANIDQLDLGAWSGPSENSPAAARDTGKGRISLALRVGRVPALGLGIRNLQAAATLENSRLNIEKFDAIVAKGEFGASGHIDLGKEGWTYDGNLSLEDARVSTLTAYFDNEALGDRTGLFGLTLDWTGAGTNLPSAWDQLDAKGEISWTQGRVSHSSYLAEISKVTGIPGFRDLIVMDSGGPFQIRNGVLSSEGLRVWGPDASIQAAGTITGSGRVDAEVGLGIGPDANRELFSTGLVLPYVAGKDGWRFIPLHLSGPIEDPNMWIAPGTVLRSALTMIPDVSIGAVSRGAHATRAVGKAVVNGGRAVVDSTVGSVFRGLKHALGGSSDSPTSPQPTP